MLVRFVHLRLICALLLALVGVQAGVPTAQALQVAHGSAFSADTHEVALSAQRRVEAARPQLAPQPLLPGPATALVPAPRRPAFAPAVPRLLPFSTAPPLRERIARGPSPRAPPLA